MHIVYKILGVKWLNQAAYPASAFVSSDRYGALNPQRFIPPNVTCNYEKTEINPIFAIYKKIV